jgi:uncharacterized ion transporter superfamily protein YfcC
VAITVPVFVFVVCGGWCAGAFSHLFVYLFIYIYFKKQQIDPAHAYTHEASANDPKHQEGNARTIGLRRPQSLQQPLPQEVALLLLLPLLVVVVVVVAARGGERGWW